jgi:hypothetical protein
MATNDEKHDEENDVVKRTEKASFDIGDLYKFRPEELILNISSTHYSNITYMQVASREVILDFLELPGIKKENKMVINGIRIYLSHEAAQTLVEKLGKLLEQAYSKGTIAELKFSKPDEVELTTKISRPIEEEKT